METELKKAVDYCYPSSPHAVQYGFDRSGCFVVTLVDHEYNAKVISAHADRMDAYRTAATMPEVWHPLWAKYDQEFIDAAEA